MSKTLTFLHLRSIFIIALGALSVWGFAPYYLFPLSILSVAGLFYFWLKSNTTHQVAQIGFLYGLGLFGVGFYWIYISLHYYGGMPMVIAGILTFLLAAFMASILAIAGVLSLRLARSHKSTLIIAMPVLLALSDWVRSWIFTGFPWMTLGYSQLPYSPLAGYMPIVGVYGVSFITALIASIIAFWLVEKPTSILWRRNSIAAIVLTFVAGSLLHWVEWTTPTGKPISVSLLQGNIPQDLKWDLDIAEHTLNKYLNMAEQSHAQLIVMPETALPVLSNELPQKLKTRLHHHASKNKGGVLVGVVEREDGHYFNSVISFDGTTSMSYRKSHLVPFGEFIPLKAALGWVYRDLLNMPLSDLSRGSKTQQPMSIAGEKIAVNICYEDVFGEEIIRQLPTATLLVNATNDAWYGDSFAADQHLQFSQARALETGRMMLRATNTGATAIIDTKGYVLANAPHFTEIILNGSAQGYTGSTPYVSWGNWPFILLSFALLIVLWWRNRATNT